MHLTPATPAGDFLQLGEVLPPLGSSALPGTTGGGCLGLRLRGQAAGLGEGISLPTGRLAEKLALQLLSGDGGGGDGPGPLMSASPGEGAGRSWGSPGRGGSGPARWPAQAAQNRDVRRPAAPGFCPVSLWKGGGLLPLGNSFSATQVAWRGPLSCGGERRCAARAGGQSGTFLLLGRGQRPSLLSSSWLLLGFRSPLAPQSTVPQPLGCQFC